MWSNAQKMMVASWSMAAQPLARAHEDKVRVWEAWVDKALSQQREWSQTLSERVAAWPGLPKPLGVLVEHTEAVNGRLFALQGEMWARWFELLRRPGLEVNESVEGEAAIAERPAPALEAVRTPVLDAEDDLTAITGVGPAIERKLRAAGVHTYRDIAGWTEADIARIESDVLGGRFSGRIRRDDWLDQARWLHAEKYGRAV